MVSPTAIVLISEKSAAAVFFPGASVPWSSLEVPPFRRRVFRERKRGVSTVLPQKHGADGATAVKQSQVVVWLIECPPCDNV